MAKKKLAEMSLMEYLQPEFDKAVQALGIKPCQVCGALAALEFCASCGAEQEDKS